MDTEEIGNSQEDETMYLSDLEVNPEEEVITMVELGVNEDEYEEVDARNVISSHRSRKFRWTTNNTKLLVKAYFDRRHRFKDPKTKKMDLWDEIATEHGFPVNMNTITMKWRNMKKTYSLIKDKLYEGNVDQGIRWEHYEIFDFLYSVDESAIDSGFLETYFADLEPLNIAEKCEEFDDDEREIYESNINNLPKFEWTPTLVKILFKGYFERIHLFKEPKKHQIKKKDLWHEISLDMTSAGFSISEDALNTKWRNLNFRYRILKEKCEKGSIGQGVRWEYYDLFELLYAEDGSKIDGDFLEEYFSKLESEMEKEGIVKQTRNDGDVPHFSWCPRSTDFLIKSYLARKESFRDPTVRKKNLWTEMWKEMIMAGFPVEEKETLDKKMRNLKKTYKDYKVTKGSAPITWAYYDRLDKIFFDDPAVIEETAEYNARPDMQEACTSESEVEYENDNTAEEPVGHNLRYEWCPRSTKFFLRSCIKRKTKFHDPNVIKKKLWTRILQEMNVAGFPIKSINVLETKMENMTKTYKTIKEKNKKNATGRGLIRWEHLAALEKFYTNDEKPRSSAPNKSEKPCSPVQTPPTPIKEKKRKHSDEMSELQNMRKKQLLVEEKKADLTEKVHESLKETNQLLRERNDLLRKLINQRIKKK